MTDSIRDTHPTEPARFCPDCGYDLRGIASNRCPECGWALSNAVISPIPWEHRQRLGWGGTFLRTLWLATFRPKRLAAAVSTPIDSRSGKLFRSCVTVAAALPAIAFMIGAIRWNHGTAFLNIVNLQPLRDFPREVPRWPHGPLWESKFIWSAGATLFPVLPIGIGLAFALCIAAIQYISHARHLPLVLQNRVIGLADYACAPLAWLFIPVLALGIAIILGTDHPANQQAFTFGATLWLGILALPAIMLLFWWNSLRLLAVAAHCGKGRIIGNAALVPLIGIASALVGLVIFPLLAGLLWLMLDSLR